jgi:hypothetical protein
MQQTTPESHLFFSIIGPILPLIAAKRERDNNGSYSESSLQWWAVNKTCNEKKNLLYTKNTYILKWLLNVVTARIEAVAWRNKFLYAYVKEICHLWAQPRFDTFHQLSLLLKRCDLNHFFW